MTTTALSRDPVAQARRIVEALACGRAGCDCGKASAMGTGLTHCPTHDDARPSLHVKVEGGKVLLFCFTGSCPQETVIAALRERGLWPGSRQDGQRPDSNIVATYVYDDERGAPLLEVCRTAKKTFPQRRPGAEEWGIKGARRVLYRLPELLAADPAEIVFISEGEKDADRLAELGVMATTNPGGAGKWRADYNESLRGRRVVILPDNDDAGRQHAEEVAASLHGAAREVKVLELPGLPEKGDVSDWLDAFGTAEELLELAEAVPEAQAASTAPIKATEIAEDGAALLDDVAAFVRRYVVLTAEQADALALWTGHTYAFEAADCTPYAHVSSAEKRSGKTKTLEVEDLLVARPWLTGRVTAAILVRKIDRDRPTLLLDESDAAFKGAQEYAEALRAVLNSGHRRGGVASLCVKAGADFDLRDFGTYCPKAIAGIGRLPDTVADRAIPIVLKRRQPTEAIERFRRSQADADALPIRKRLAAWAAAHLDELREARPEVPAGLDDRAADGWEPLFAIADLAGGDWPRRARVAALVLSAGGGREDESLGVRLLGDIRTVFEERNIDRLPSTELCRALNGLEESPWGDLRGKPLDPRGLARLLRPFGVRPQGHAAGHQGTIRLDEGQTVKGYLAEWFADAWGRYLPYPQGPSQASQASHGPDSDSGDVTAVTDVTANTGVREGEV